MRITGVTEMAENGNTRRRKVHGVNGLMRDDHGNGRSKRTPTCTKGVGFEEELKSSETRLQGKGMQ